MKMNGNLRFVEHKQHRSSGKSTQNKKKFFMSVDIFYIMKSGIPLSGLAKSV